MFQMLMVHDIQIAMISKHPWYSDIHDIQTPSPFLIYDIYHAILSYLKMWYEWEIPYHFLRDDGIYHDPYHPIISRNLSVEFGKFSSPDMAKITVKIPLHGKINDKM